MDFKSGASFRHLPALKQIAAEELQSSELDVNRKRNHSEVLAKQKQSLDGVALNFREGVIA